MENLKLNIHISNGNNKMGAIPSVSLPPVVTCRQGAPCVKKCYACKLCRLRSVVRQSYIDNLNAFAADKEFYFNYISIHCKMYNFFRWNVAGDIVNTEYLSGMVKVAKENPHCKFLAFTKQYEIVNNYPEKIPENLQIIFSLWGKELNPENPHNFPYSNIIFKKGTAPDDVKICGGNCAECACRGIGCWELQKGEIIAFYEH